MKLPRLLNLILLIPLNYGAAQNWSEPVAVSSGHGDDHHVSVGYLNYQGPLLLAWDRTANDSTDIYARTFDTMTGELGQEIRVTTSPATDELPSVVEYANYGNGIFYQSDEFGLTSIHYADFDGHEFTDPWRILYSNSDLYEPKARIEGASVPSVTVLCRNYSAVLMHYFDSLGPEPGVLFYIWSEGEYPLYSFDGYWAASMAPGTSSLRWAWEVEIDGQHEIYYSFNVFVWPGSNVTGYIPNDSASYHLPAISGDNLYIEREYAGDFDIVRTQFDDITGVWTFPEPCFELTGNEKNPAVALVDNLVFEADWNGNWDIAFWHPYLDEPEVIDADPSEDRNPLVWSDDDTLHVFWESNRDGNWDIYYSYRDVVGVEQEKPVYLPEDLSVSIYPNPFNSATVISFELPVAGEVNLAIYDVAGRQVSLSGSGTIPTTGLVDGWREAGRHEVTFAAEGLASGVYFVLVRSGNVVLTEKLVLLK